jgi:molybdopterin converting factor small subunit
MIGVWLHSNIARLGDGRINREHEAADNQTVGTVIRSVFADDRVLLSAIIDETGSVRRHINIFLENDNIRHLEGLDTPVADGAQISVFTAISGG